MSRFFQLVKAEVKDGCRGEACLDCPHVELNHNMYTKTKCFNFGIC